MEEKEYEGLTLHQFNHAQIVDMKQFRYTIHKEVLHVPSCMIVDHPLDWSLMERALNIEIERNDCLRLRFTKVEEDYKQYYIPKYSVSAIPVDDYRGMDEEKAKKLLHKRGSHPVLDFLHGEVFRVRFFYSHDGRCGVYLCACHLIMDLAAEFIFYKDLFGVYDALENGKELPAPLDKSEEMLEHELERINNEQRREKDIEFYRNYFAAHNKFCYSSPDGTRLLDAYRKKTKDPTKQLLSSPAILFDKTTTMTNVIGADLASGMYAFLEKQNISLATLFYLAYRTYLSSVNNRAEEICFDTILNRRSTLKENNCGGNRAVGVYMVTNVKENMTFKDALSEVSKTMMQLYAHLELSNIEVDTILHEALHSSSPIEQAASMIFSCMPPVPFPEELKEWNPDFEGFSNGHFPMLDYTIIVPNERTGEILLHNDYNTHFLSKEIIDKMNKAVMKVIEMGISDPDMTIGTILDSLN